jgi:hypothetical protein
MKERKKRKRIAVGFGSKDWIKAFSEGGLSPCSRAFSLSFLLSHPVYGPQPILTRAHATWLSSKNLVPE